MVVRPTRVLPREPAVDELLPHFAAVLSALLPGLGQLYGRRPRRALYAFVIPAGAVALVLAAILLIDPIQSFVVGRAGVVALVILGTLLAFHVAVVIDAFALATPFRGPRPRQLLVAFAAVGVLVLIYGTLYQRSAAWGGVLARVIEEPPPSKAAPRALPATRPPDWTGRERYNVLLLGLDSRADDVGETQNTDTMILLSLDPVNRTAAMISIPRDVHVDHPAMGNEKVNAAYAIGGPDLSRRVIERLFGVPIHSYAVVDFDAFTKIVDASGGVFIDARLPLRDEAYPTHGGGVERLDILAGPQVFNGTTALKYARSRHSSNDFGRARRQQEILTALKIRFSRDSALMALPALMDRVGNVVRSNVDPGDVLPLARLVAGIDNKHIRSEVLVPCGNGEDPCELIEQNRPDGYYLFPDPARIKALVADLLPDPARR